MKKILITGAAGFIGSALCNRLALNNKIIGLDVAGFKGKESDIIYEQIDISDFNSVTTICEKYSPEAVIHCAGIAHQKFGAVSLDTYKRVNSEATENLAKVAAGYNSKVQFIFLSSVSVYGEENLNTPVSEDSACCPSGDYAVSKLDAEKRLLGLFNAGIIQDLVILRLAAVYDRNWSFNLDRRVFTPKKISYLRFGKGTQRISALARPNLVDFIDHIIQDRKEKGLDSDIGAKEKRQNLQIFNVSDADAYEFNAIIKIFRKSGIYPKRPIISVPVFFVWILTRIASILFFHKREWIRSCYDKLASDLVFDNQKMIKTGFQPKHSLSTIFL